MIIKLLVEGGNMKPGPTLAQKVGPLGLNMGKLISDVNTATKNFTGMKVPVAVEIDTKTKIALEKNLKSAVKTTLGSCVSLGILVESKDPKEIIKEVDKGVYDKEIANPSKPSEEKLAKLNEYFDAVKKKQAELLKKEEEEKAKEAAAAAALAPAAQVAVAGAAAPTAAAKAPAKEAKPEEKKK